MKLSFAYLKPSFNFEISPRTQTCGSPAGSENCADSPCGGLSCVDGEGNRKCGGEGCDGLTTLAHNAWQKAKDFDLEIISAMEEVDKLSKMVRFLSRHCICYRYNKGFCNYFLHFLPLFGSYHC